jgi:hypothetical protein
MRSGRLDRRWRADLEVLEMSCPKQVGSKCPVCGLTIADPEDEPVELEPAEQKPDAWSRGEYIPGWHASQPHGPVR